MTGNKSFDSDASVDMKPLPTPIGLKDPQSDRAKSLHDNEFANRLKAKKSTNAQAAPFSMADLLTATANFATGRLLGEGTIGRVYRAKYPDGKVCFDRLLLCLLPFLFSANLQPVIVSLHVFLIKISIKICKTLISMFIN